MEIKEWVTKNASHRRIPLKHIRSLAPELKLQGVGCKAMKTAMKSEGMERRHFNRQGVSNLPEHIAARLHLARLAIRWTPEGLSRQMFSDESLLMISPTSNGYVSVQVQITRSKIWRDRYHVNFLRRIGWMGWIVHGYITTADT